VQSRGVTLIEVLMAVALVAILSVVGVTAFTDFSKDARIVVTKERMGVIKAAIVGDARLVVNGQYVKPGYLAQVGAVPSDLEDLVTQPGGVSSYDVYSKSGWNGPYLSAETDWDKDAWGEDFVYSSGGRSLTSKGPDETQGTSDDIVVTF
jgi:prepilin-type N-terminal cleavage/methylation domain-containing protein